MYGFYINEFSDYRPLTFLFVVVLLTIQSNLLSLIESYGTRPEIMNLLIRYKINEILSKRISDKLFSGELDIDQCMMFSDTVFDISCFGRTFINRPKPKKRKSLLFNNDCKIVKNEFIMQTDDTPCKKSDKNNLNKETIIVKSNGWLKSWKYV